MRLRPAARALMHSGNEYRPSILCPRLKYDGRDLLRGDAVAATQWQSKEGLLVSVDNGATWRIQGKAVEASIGPYFDPQNELRIVVAGAKGIFQTDDGGEVWKLVARLPTGFEKLPKAGWFTNVAWDPVHDLFYVSHMGQPTYRFERAK